MLKNRHFGMDAEIQRPGMAICTLWQRLIRHRRNHQVTIHGLDAFGTSLSRTLWAAEPCKSAVLPICPASLPK